MKRGQGSRLDADGRRTTARTALLATEYPAPLTLDRLAHEYALRDELDAAGADQPVVPPYTLSIKAVRFVPSKR